MLKKKSKVIEIGMMKKKQLKKLVKEQLKTKSLLNLKFFLLFLKIL